METELKGNLIWPVDSDKSRPPTMPGIIDLACVIDLLDRVEWGAAVGWLVPLLLCSLLV